MAFIYSSYPEQCKELIAGEPRPLRGMAGSKARLVPSDIPDSG